MARPASVIGPTLAAASCAGSRASSAAKPSAALRVGTTDTGRSLIEATWRAASTTFGLFGRSRTSRAATAPTASSSSPVLGLADWPPWTTAATPKSRKIAARPSPAVTAMTARAGASRWSCRWSTPRPSRVPAGAVPRSARGRLRLPPVNAAARVSRTSRAWLSRFSTLIRLSVPSPRP